MKVYHDGAMTSSVTDAMLILTRAGWGGAGWGAGPVTCGGGWGGAGIGGVGWGEEATFRLHLSSSTVAKTTATKQPKLWTLQPQLLIIYRAVEYISILPLN